MFSAPPRAGTQGRKPFAPQLALMSKLLTGVQRRENCLLESPTGTGKTLALLSAALAWQRQQREHGLAMESDCEAEDEDEPMASEGSREPDPLQQSFDDFRYVEPKAGAQVELAYEDDGSSGSVVTSSKENKKPTSKEETRASFYGDDFDDDAFESPKKKRQKAPKPRAPLPQRDDEDDPRTSDSEVDAGSSPASCVASPTTERDPSEELDSPASCASGGAELAPATSSKSAAENATSRAKQPTKQEKKKAQRTRRRVPRVFFCSRTHSQLNQVVAELRTCRTAFQDTSAAGIGEDGRPFSMALLASRKSTCINKEGETAARAICTTHACFVDYLYMSPQRDKCVARVCGLHSCCIWSVTSACHFARQVEVLQQTLAEGWLLQGASPMPRNMSMLINTKPLVLLLLVLRPLRTSKRRLGSLQRS